MANKTKQKLSGVLGFFDDDLEFLSNFVRT